MPEDFYLGNAGQDAPLSADRPLAVGPRLRRPG